MFRSLLGHYLDSFYFFVYLSIPMSSKYLPALSCLHNFKLCFNCRILYITQRCSTLLVNDLQTHLWWICASKFKFSIIRQLCNKSDSNGVVPASLCRVDVMRLSKKMQLTLLSQIILFQCLLFSLFICVLMHSKIPFPTLFIGGLLKSAVSPSS